MSLNPLIQTRAWLHKAPWLWDGLVFLGHHAGELMAAAFAWIFFLLLIKTRRAGLATGAQPADGSDVSPDTTQGTATLPPNA